jgi:DNA repair photolyase
MENNNMIISASRRTDIPAFYSEWLMNRIQAGFCTTVNPYNRKQISYVSLKPEEVDIIVFWTKNPEPLMPFLKELDARGYKYYFQFTLNGYPRIIEPNVPSLAKSLNTFKKLAEQIGPNRVIWRYDPILVSNATGIDYHKKQIEAIARELAGYTHRLVISVVDEYRKATYNFARLSKEVKIVREIPEDQVKELMNFIVSVSRQYKMEIFSCAELLNLADLGIKPGKCIDDEYIQKVFGFKVTPKKDKSQRKECGCVVSKDIGAYDTCFQGCLYCYAGTMAAAQRNKSNHFPDSPSIIGRYEAPPPGNKNDDDLDQPALF